MKINYIKNLRRVLAAANRRATFYDDDLAWSNAYAKNTARVLPRGGTLNRIIRREFKFSKTIISPRYPIEIMHVEREIGANGRRLELE